MIVKMAQRNASHRKMNTKWEKGVHPNIDMPLKFNVRHIPFVAALFSKDQIDNKIPSSLKKIENKKNIIN